MRTKVRQQSVSVTPQAHIQERQRPELLSIKIVQEHLSNQ